MVMIEMKDAAYDMAFDLLDEAKLNAKKTKLTLCELENAMYECYEASQEGRDNDDETEMKFRGVSGYKDYDRDEDRSMRDEDESEVKSLLKHRRNRMRMRRRLI